MDHKNNVKMHERVKALEVSYDHIDERLECIEKKLDTVRTQIATWKGSFGIIAALSGILGGGIVTLVVWLITN